MSETLKGTFGKWGLPSDETAAGLIMENLEQTTRAERDYTKNNKGCRIGRSEYDESVQVTLSGERLSTADWTQKLSAELALTNALSLINLNAVTAGKTLIDEVKRSLKREGWEGINVDAEVLPFFPA